ncbi:MAG TPA: RNA polymerase sigma factor [Pseudomonadales bacterium]|nr:RNA polymerase sigma factor [Pseudomonadales bacterium]
MTRARPQAAARTPAPAPSARASDAELIAELRASGDPRCFEVLVRRHQGTLRGWLRGLTHDPALADDLAQDTFLKAWSALPTYRGDGDRGDAGAGSFRAWLFSIARNAFIGTHRRAAVEARARARSAPVDEAAPGPEAALGDLEPLLAQLSDVERDCLTLAYAFDFTRGEIAAALQIPEGTVKSHIHRARRRLDLILDEEAPAS